MKIGFIGLGKMGKAMVLHALESGIDVAATTLAQTNLRNLIGDKTLDETLIARDIINTNLRDVEVISKP